MFTRLAPIQMDEEHSRASSSLRKRRCVASKAQALRDSGVRGSLSKVIDSLAARYPFSIVHLLEFESRRRILSK